MCGSNRVDWTRAKRCCARRWHWIRTTPARSRSSTTSSRAAANPTRLFGGLAGHPFAEALGPARHALLLGALDCKSIGLDILGDHRSGPDHRSVADRHRSHQSGVRANERPGADHRAIFAEPVVIAGDGAGADVGRRADFGVADIA